MWNCGENDRKMAPCLQYARVLSSAQLCEALFGVLFLGLAATFHQWCRLCNARCQIFGAHMVQQRLEMTRVDLQYAGESLM